MKKIVKFMNGTIIAITTSLIVSCSGGGIKSLNEEVVSKPFSEYFQIVDNGSKIERVQDGDWVHYEFKTLINIKKTFPCVDYMDEKKSVFDHDKMKIKLTFYDVEKKPLSINGTQMLEFFTHANTTVGKTFCDVIGQKEGNDAWFSFKTRNFKKGESEYFEAYPDGDIEYFSVESAL